MSVMLPHDLLHEAEAEAETMLMRRRRRLRRRMREEEDELKEEFIIVIIVMLMMKKANKCLPMCAVHNTGYRSRL